jgi:hypothetical protein
MVVVKIVPVFPKKLETQDVRAKIMMELRM